MELDFITLAENVAIAENKLYIHGGGLNVFPVPQLPWLLQLSVAGRFEATEDELGVAHELSLMVLQPNEQPMFPLQPISVTLGPQHRIAPDWGVLQVLLSIKLQPIALHQTGWYIFNIGLDNERISQRPLLVQVIQG